MGEPWTGQLKLSDIDLLTVTSGGMRLDNLGADPPIGSRIMLTFKMHSNKMYHLTAGIRKDCSPHQHQRYVSVSVMEREKEKCDIVTAMQCLV